MLPSCETPDAWTTAVVRGVPLSLVFPADIVRAVMTGQEPSKNPHGDDGQQPPDTGMGMTAVSYLLTGMLVWGGIGWLVDPRAGGRLKNAQQGDVRLAEARSQGHVRQHLFGQNRFVEWDE